MDKKTTLFDDPELMGWEYVHAHRAAADEWFRELFAAALGGSSLDEEEVALVAIGGYGRGELWPYSDLDVMLLHRGQDGVAEIAEKLWYPVWDRGIKLGHGLFTIEESIELAMQELDHATALMSCRYVAGDFSLFREIQEATETLWNEHVDEMMERLSERVVSRHFQVSDVAFTIEPELKEGRGGLRDLHTLAWAERACPGFASVSLSELHNEARVLTEVRVELHRLRGRAGDVLSLDDQDGVAEALGDEDGQVLMYRLAQGARRIAWYSDEAWRRWSRERILPERRSHPVPISAQLELVDAQVELRPEISPDSDELLILRVAEAAARTGNAIGRRTLRHLRDYALDLPVPWPEKARDLFAGLFMAGHSAIPVVEDLDHFGLMVRLIPEWQDVQAKPQRNVLHTFTVDRHLVEAAANAAELIEDVARPDLLVVGALLHDIGKGLPGDHTEVGMELIATIGTRMGYPASDVGVLIDLCRHHLLLPDVATRRDISDAGTIRAVAAAVRTEDFLFLLAALTQADSIATGPSAWGSWKAGLIQDLVARTSHVLAGGEVDEVTPDFPGEKLLTMMALGEQSIVGKRTKLTVIAKEVDWLFGRVAGVVALSGLEVLDAAAVSDDDGMAVCQFIVQEPHSGPVDWDKVTGLVRLALDSQLALTARVAKRAQAYHRYRRRLAAEPARRLVNVDNTISEGATVVDVHAPDTIGLLFRLTRAINELELTIRSAKVQTLGPEAVDCFYLRDVHGEKIVDEDLLKELELALQDAMGDEE